tara:strand:+ start:328 stop:474 length:147 start_codon:yes stop_codon:yes gene_type:complete
MFSDGDSDMISARSVFERNARKKMSFQANDQPMQNAIKSLAKILFFCI